MMEETKMVLNLPRKASAMKAPSNGRRDETPTQVFTFFAAMGIGSWSSFVRYVMRLPAIPK